MEYRRLGRTGLMVGEVGFGSHHFDWAGQRIGRLTPESFSERDRVRQVAVALDSGINYFHCAHTIGDQCNAEIALFGKCLKELHRRDECYLAAQYQAVPGVSLRDVSALVCEQIEQHLVDLETDRLEIFEFNIHEDLAARADDELVTEVLGAMERVREQGKALHIGGVSHDRGYLVYLMKKMDPFATVGTPYNVLIPDAREELFPLARQRDVGTVAIQPFGKGRVLALSPLDERLAATRRPGEGVAAAGLRWVLSDPNLSVAIPGMKTVEEILENVGISGTGHTTHSK